MSRSKAPSSPYQDRPKGPELLIVDGYNVIFKSPRYTELMDESNDGDPFILARQKLIADVATYAKGKYDAIVVFDAAGNFSPDRPNIPQAGIRVIFSKTGETADTVIERIATTARLQPRAVTVITSDSTIRATVGGIPVKRVSSDVLVADVDEITSNVDRIINENVHQRMTIEDRLDPETRAKLNKLIGRG